MASGMAAGLTRSYLELMENADDRVEDWFLMSSPIPIACIIATYIWFIKYAGPKWMENKEPYDLRRFLQIYNVFQVCFNGWLFYEGFISWSSHLKYLSCAPVDYSRQPFAVKEASLVWWYFILKLTELTDTITFVLRKKMSHVSKLHVYHHSVMPISAWAGAKFVPGGHTIFSGFLNSGVHVVMYSYYFLSTLGPEVQKKLFWKTYLTSLQMYQFLIIVLHSIPMLLRSDCNYPKSFDVWIIFQAIIFYAFFNEFYKQKYGKTAGLNSVLRDKLK